MRILKIELQNINSLKSDNPIKIDFEEERFKDVGLFAITGPTGAGKTTMLDAITIALYHQVPRFNKSHVKAGLEDVVSYGAEGAMCRITFESKKNQYEAFWSIRLKGRGGKRLSTPKEEVRLKDLSKGKIIAEKKRELVSKVEQITHLDYQQFLRSAMLAQGEFAAFLSAKVDEKGKLLEQITGQDIYKRIGESIVDRISAERKILERINAEVNLKDVLSTEQITQLNQEKQNLYPELKACKLSLSELQKMAEWFKQLDELRKAKQVLEHDQNAWQQQKEDLKEEHQLLALHLKAELYKPDLDALVKWESALKEHKEKQERTQTRLVDLKPLLGVLKSELEKQQKKEQETKAHQAKWTDKLEQTSKYDTLIKERTLQKNVLNQEKEEADKAFEDIQKRLRINSNQKKQLEQKFAQLEETCHKNQHLEELEKYLGEWKTTAALWREAYKDHQQTLQNITEQNKLFKTVSDKLTRYKNDLGKKQHDLKQANEVQAKYSSDLQKLDLPKIQALLEANRLQTEKVTSGLVLSESFVKDTQRIKDGKVAIAELELEIKRIKTHLNTKQKEEAQLAVLLKDARKIVDLELKIKNFEEERKNLRKGEACPLCGAKDHPLVEHYTAAQLSESQTVLQLREENAKTLAQEISNLQAEIAEKNGRLKAFNEGLKNIQINLRELEEQYALLKLEVPLSDAAFFKNEKQRLELDQQSLLSKQKTEQDLQAAFQKNNELLVRLKDESAEINSALSAHTQHLEGINEQLQKLERSKLEMGQKVRDYKNTLEKSLSKFDWELPEIEHLDSFLEQVNEMIAGYKKSIKDKEETEKELIRVRELGAGLINEHKDKSDKQQKQLSALLKLQQEIKTISEARNTLLPLSITVETKRMELSALVKKAEENLQLKSKEFQQKQAEEISLNDYKQTLEKEHASLVAEKTSAEQKFVLAIEHSPFLDRKALVDALLSEETKQSIEKRKKDFEAEEIRLNTLQNELQQREAVLSKRQNASKTKEEIYQENQVLEQKRDELLKRVGEIDKQFEIDQQIKARNKTVFDRIAAQEKELKKWKDLLQLLGGSKDAFNRYVQRLTLQNLVQLANLHLFQLNPRYSLKMSDTYKPGEELNFSLVDHYQTNRMRPVDTSSGGEKFLISLSLALGLSDLASNNVKIESLFIDEGFGTLDSATLEVVLSALEALQVQGKMIGVISHVENMKERIPTQIQVQKKASGVSEVVII